MIAWYIFLLFLLHYACGSSQNNVGRLMSQRKFAYYDRPVCERSSTQRCNRHSLLCKTNLEGYYKRSKYIKCPAGTRCGCQPNGECEGKLRRNPCIAIVKPYPMQERATFTFSGTTAHVWTGLAYPLEWSMENRYVVSPPTTSKVVGLVKQDVREGKFLQVITKQHVKDLTTGGNSFTLIVPSDDDDTYIKYMGHLPDRKCKRTVLKKFEPFGMDIENYLLTKTEKEDGTALQTWEYKYNVEWMDVANFRWKWIIESDVATKTSYPVSSYYYDDQAFADDDWQFEKVQNIDWQTHNLDLDWTPDIKWYSDMWTEKGDWFRIPPFCL